MCSPAPSFEKAKWLHSFFIILLRSLSAAGFCKLQRTFLEPFLRCVWGRRRATRWRRVSGNLIERSSAKAARNTPHRVVATHEPLSPCSQAYRTRGPQHPRRPLRLLRRAPPRNGPVRLALHHPRARRERFCGRLVSFFFHFFLIKLQLITDFPK